MRHWADQYVGTPYVEYDCADLCVQVQQAQFNKAIGLPASRPNGLRGVSDMIETLQDDFATPTVVPVEGDAVQMIGRGRLNHIGILCTINHEPHVLHAMKNAGMTVLHKIVALKDIGLIVEGYYKWK